MFFWDRNAWGQPCAHVTCLCKGRLQPDTYSFFSLLSGLGKLQRSLWLGQHLATLLRSRLLCWLIHTLTGSLKRVTPVITNSTLGGRTGMTDFRRMPTLQDIMLLHRGKEHQKWPPPHTDFSRSCYFQQVLILSPQICHLLKRKALSINRKSMESIQLKNTQFKHFLTTESFKTLDPPLCATTDLVLWMI